MRTIVDAEVPPRPRPASKLPGPHFNGSSGGRTDRRSPWDGPLLILAAVMAMALIASVVGVGLGLRAVERIQG